MKGFPPGFDAHVHTFAPTADDVWAVERVMQPRLALVGWSRRRAIARDLRADPGLAASFTIGIGEAGVAWSSATGGSQVPWSRVGAVERRREDVLIRLTRPAGVARLPRRVASADEVERFAAAATAWMSAASGAVDLPLPTDAGTHHVRFLTERADLEAFLGMMAVEHPEGFGRVMPSWITLGLGAVALALAPRALAAGDVSAALAEIVFGLFIGGLGLLPAVRPAINRGIVRRHWRRVQADRPEAAIALGPEGILQTDAYGRHSTPWSAVRRVVCTPEHLFLFLAGGGALIVPARALPGLEALDALRRDVRAWQAAAEPGAPPRPEVPLAAPRAPGDPFEPPASA